MAEEKKFIKAVDKEVPEKAAAKSNKVNVKNITKKDINTQDGCIKAGEIGFVTCAEASNLHNYFEVVK